jgi:hypothetical protein
LDCGSYSGAAGLSTRAVERLKNPEVRAAVDEELNRHFALNIFGSLISTALVLVVMILPICKYCMTESLFFFERTNAYSWTGNNNENYTLTDDVRRSSAHIYKNYHGKNETKWD